MSDKSLYTRSVERAIDILECFMERDVLSLHEIAEATSLPDSTALRIINSLRKRGYVARVPCCKSYRLGDRFLLFTACENQSYVRLKSAGAASMQALYQSYDENLQLFTFNGAEFCSVLAFESTRMPHPPIWEEKRKWGPSAAGRIFLAYQDEEQKRLMDPEGQVENEALAKIIDDGYTLCVDPKDISVVGIAAPVFLPSGALQAVLQLSGPASRFVNERIMDKIKDTARTAQEISRLLGEQTGTAIGGAHQDGGEIG